VIYNNLSKENNRLIGKNSGHPGADENLLNLDLTGFLDIIPFVIPLRAVLQNLVDSLGALEWTH
jgi:hypothetical protein